MSYLARQVSPGSVVEPFRAGSPVAVVRPLPMSASAPTGRGYADHHFDPLPGTIRASHMEMSVIRPIVGTQNLVTAFMPEPGTTLQLVAGALSLLGIAAWRSRRNR